MIGRRGEGVPRQVRTVGAWSVGAVLLEAGSQIAGVEGDRFGRTVVSVVMLAGLLAAQRARTTTARAAVVALVIVAAAVAPGAATEVVLALVALAVVAALAHALGVAGAEPVTEPVAAEPVLFPETGGTPPVSGNRTGVVMVGWRRFVRPVAQWFAVLVPVNVVLSVAGAVADTRPDGRIVWDASNFIDIARDGYASSRVLAASFPGYAMVIRFANEVLGLDHELAAILISDLCGLAAALLFWEWSLKYLGEPARRLALWLFLLYPYSFVIFGVAYADGLLLALVLASLLAVDRDHPVLAGLLGAAATFTRPNGLVLIPVLALAVAEHSGVIDTTMLGRRSLGFRARLAGVRFDRTRFRPRQLGALLAVGGIGGFMVWMRQLTGDPIFFWSVQTTNYGHRAFSDPETWLKVEFVNRPWAFMYNGLDAFNQVVSFLIIVAVVLSLPAAGRRFGWAYAGLGLGAVATVWVTASGFSPAGRYLLPYLPVMAVLAAGPLERRPIVRRVVLVVGAAGSLLLAAGFASAFRLNW